MAIVLCAVCLAGCAPKMKVITDYEPSGRFEEYKTWDWMTLTQKKVGDPRIDAPDVDQLIRETVQQHMKDKGFTRTTKDPDVRLNYILALSDDLNEAQVNAAYGAEYYEGYPNNWESQRFASSYTNDFTMGTLIIDILDMKSKLLVWRGMAEAEVKEQIGEREREERVNNAILKILENYPPEIKKEDQQADPDAKTEDADASPDGE